MMVKDLIDILPMQLETRQDTLSKPVTGIYCGDLLSLVMANAQEGNAWITIQSHINVVAVASLVGLAAIIVVEGNTVDLEVIEKADQEGIAIFTTKNSAYDIASMCAQNLSFNKKGV